MRDAIHVCLSLFRSPEGNRLLFTVAVYKGQSAIGASIIIIIIIIISAHKLRMSQLMQDA
jgi:flagellin-like protein